MSAEQPGGTTQLGAQLDDLLLPWRIDLQLDHLIRHEGLKDHIERAGVCLWQRHQNQGIPQSSNAASQ